MAMKIRVMEAADPSRFDFVAYGGGVGGSKSASRLTIYQTLDAAYEAQKREWGSIGQGTTLKLPKGTPLTNVEALERVGGKVSIKENPRYGFDQTELRVPGLGDIRLGAWGEPMPTPTRLYLVDGKWVSEAEARKYYVNLLSST